MSKSFLVAVIVKSLLRFNCHFESMKVYFDNAIIHNGNAVVSIDASFAGLELYIPRTWSIADKTNLYFCSIDEYLDVSLLNGHL